MDLYKLIFSVLLIRYNTIRACTPVALINGNALFAKKMYPILARGEGNVLYSPVSAHAILSLAYQGATGNTAKSLENALHMANPIQTAADYQSLLKILHPMANVTLSMVNKVFVQENIKVNAQFETFAKNYFLAEVENINFLDNFAAAKHINDWVNSQTNQKITNVVQPIDLNASTRLVLVNANYFIGNWKQPFNWADTAIQRFYLSEHDAVYCDMMHLHGNFSYNEDNDLDSRILRLPYKNDMMALTIILPKKRSGIKQLEKKLLTTSVNFRPQYYEANIRLSLPRFRIQSELNLQKSMTELGLGAIFTPSAEFPKLAESESVYVNKAIQKTYIEVNEVGTEGSGGAGGPIRRQQPSPEIIFTADHPFIFLVTYRQGNGLLPLFIGKLARP